MIILTVWKELLSALAAQRCGGPSASLGINVRVVNKSETRLSDKPTAGDTNVPKGVQQCGLADVGHTDDEHIQLGHVRVLPCDICFVSSI